MTEQAVRQTSSVVELAMGGYETTATGRDTTLSLESKKARELFIVHADSDVAFVKGYLLPELNLMASQVLLIDDLPPGALTVVELDRCVSSSRFVIVVLSPACLEDRWASFGEQLASHVCIESARIIPLKLVECSLPLRLDVRVALDFTQPARWEREMTRLRDVLQLSPPVVDQIDCPYPGMRSFTPGDFERFFGREAEVEDIISRLDRGERQIYVIGPSGSGKSSLVHAGLLHALEVGTSRLGQSFVARAMRPGERPSERLREVLGGDLMDPVGALEEVLRNHSPARHALIFIDQLEELFTHATIKQRNLFISLLRELQKDERCYFVLALRADFYGALMDSELWPSEPRMSRIDIAPLRGAALAQAILRPAMRVGVHIDARLGDRLVADAAGEPGALPLLQETLRMLWERRRCRYLGTAEYEELGEGVRGLEMAVARRAETAMSSLSDAEQAMARRVLLRLVSFGEGRADTRRQVRLADLQAASDGSGFKRVVTTLVCHRLIVVDGDGRDSLVDLSHEALLVAWPRLRGWIADRRLDEQRRRKFEQRVVEWSELGRGKSSLLDATQLAEAVRWMQSQTAHELGLTVGLEDLVTTSRRELARHRRLTLFALLALPLIVGSAMLAGEFRRQKVAAQDRAEELRLAGKNLGSVELEIVPFDLIDGVAMDIDAAALPALSWRVHGAQVGDEHHPGAELPGELVHRRGTLTTGQRRLDHVELPGGTAFFRIEGRGRTGQVCAPSWIRVRELPGYAARKQQNLRVTLRVPSCAASAAGMIAIEAGPFIYGGRGERVNDAGDPESTVVLPRFTIDRTEVSNAQFAPFASMHLITGYPAPDYPKEGLLAGSNGPRMPLAAIDAFEAEAFCRYMGKRLPGDHEWVKAARGGLEINGVPNLHPRRLYPWGAGRANKCSNDGGSDDGYAWVAPVDAIPCSASPYGVLNLVGNVAEWISREGQLDREDNPLWVIRGGEADLAPEYGLSNTVARNMRAGRQFNFATGVRCVSEG